VHPDFVPTAFHLPLPPGTRTATATLSRLRAVQFTPPKNAAWPANAELRVLDGDGRPVLFAAHDGVQFRFVFALPAADARARVLHVAEEGSVFAISSGTTELTRFALGPDAPDASR
jgi:hypothetical protein